MTPYELRFQIFQQAQGLAESEFQAAFETAERWNEKNTVKMDYPEYPTFERIKQLAENINSFISSK
jgi:hypothetical protein